MSTMVENDEKGSIMGKRSKQMKKKQPISVFSQKNMKSVTKCVK
jgi:hypothetical protein